MPNTSLRRPQKGFRRGGKVAFHGSSRTRTFAATTSARGEATSTDEKWERTTLANRIDENMGFSRHEAGRRREGWLVSVQASGIEDQRIAGGGGRAALDCYFIEEDGSTFKATVEYEPYFLVACRAGREGEVEEWCKRVPGGGVVKTVKKVEKEDLAMPNHLVGYRRTFLELHFANVQDLMAARRDIMPIAEKNRKGMDAMDTYAEVAA
jgi:DNA polymerase epsilon subunit 1